MSEEKSKWLSQELQDQLNRDWESLRRLSANSKGDHYEKKLQSFLDSYFGSLFDIRVKAAIIDPEKRCFEHFKFDGDDEIDVVASFKQSNPSVVFETGEEPDTIPWVPYEGVAFICEVKSQLQKQSLIDDLEKLEKVSKLDATIGNRFGPNIAGEYTVTDPLKCLVYDKASISDDTLEEILEDNLSHWDLVLIVEEDTIILNSELPVAEMVIPSSDRFGPSDLDGPLPDEALEIMEEDWGVDTDPDMITVDRGLLWFITTLSVSIPDPLSVSTINSILTLTQGTTTHSGAKKSMREDDQPS